MKFEIPLYPTNSVLTVIVNEHTEAHSYFKTIGDNLPWCKGYAVEIKGKFYLYLNKDNYDAGTISHEAVHITWLMNDHLNLVGNSFTSETQELQSYFVGYIVNEIDKKL